MSEEKNGDQAPNPNRDLVPANPVNPLVATFGNQLGTDVCSFNLETPEGRQLLQKCEEAPDNTLMKMVGKRLNLVHVYAKAIELENPQTNELVPCLRICVSDADGQVYSCVSEGIRQALGRFMRGRKLPPWNPPIPVEVTLKQTGKKHNWLTLLEVFDRPAAGGRRA